MALALKTLQRHPQKARRTCAFFGLSAWPLVHSLYAAVLLNALLNFCWPCHMAMLPPVSLGMLFPIPGTLSFHACLCLYLDEYIIIIFATSLSDFDSWLRKMPLLVAVLTAWYTSQWSALSTWVYPLGTLLKLWWDPVINTSLSFFGLEPQRTEHRGDKLLCPWLFSL